METLILIFCPCLGPYKAGTEMVSLESNTQILFISNGDL